MAALLLAGCGEGRGEGADHPAPALRGGALVAGSSVESWGVLLVPRGGGRAELRSFDDPSRVLWNGTTTLPASVEAHPLGGGVAILRAADGTLHRYDPATDAVTRIGRVGEEAVWHGFGGAGAWTDPGEGSVFVVTPGDAWRAPVPETPLWAAALDDGTAVAIVGGAGSVRPLLLERDGAPGARSPEGGTGIAPTSVRPPAEVTAWGRRIAASAPDGRSLLILSVPELTPARATEVDEPITALAPSPSSHEIYLALGRAPARIVAVARSTGRTRTLGRLPGAVDRLRPAVLGGHLLVGGSDGSALLPLDGGDAVPLSGGWRSDLPLGLPDGRVLVPEGTGVALWSPGADGNGESMPVEGAPDGWWLPVRWRPPRPTRIAEGEAEPGRAAGGPGAAGDTVGRRAEPGAGGPVAARPEADEAAGAGPPGPETATAASAAQAPLAAGFYAIVASSQRPEAIGSLAERLDRAGFRSSVQRHRDEANELWYRAMVGPYGTREEAEAAARQLRRERGLQAWISEVGPDARPDDATP